MLDHNHSETTQPSHKGLIIMAHGSRNTNANTEFIRLVNQIQTQTHMYALTTHCFLELAEPTLVQATEAGLHQGIFHFDLYPVFFNQGNHVTRDIPQQIAATQQALPQSHIHQLSYFGTFTSLANTISQHIQQQL